MALRDRHHPAEAVRITTAPRSRADDIASRQKRYIYSMGLRTVCFVGAVIVGTSPDGIDAAVRNGISRASKTLRHVDWFEITQVRGQVKDGAVEHFQVGIKVGFRLEDE